MASRHPAGDQLLQLQQSSSIRIYTARGAQADAGRTAVQQWREHRIASLSLNVARSSSPPIPIYSVPRPNDAAFRSRSLAATRSLVRRHRRDDGQSVVGPLNRNILYLFAMNAIHATREPRPSSFVVFIVAVVLQLCFCCPVRHAYRSTSFQTRLRS